MKKFKMDVVAYQYLREINKNNTDLQITRAALLCDDLFYSLVDIRDMIEDQTEYNKARRRIIDMYQAEIEKYIDKLTAYKVINFIIAVEMGAWC